MCEYSRKLILLVDALSGYCFDWSARVVEMGGPLLLVQAWVKCWRIEPQRVIPSGAGTKSKSSRCCEGMLGRGSDMADVQAGLHWTCADTVC